MGALQAFSALVDARHRSQSALAQLFLRLVEPLPVLHRHDHRQRSMVTFDKESLTGGGGVEDGAQRTPEIERRDASHSQP